MEPERIPGSQFLIQLGLFNLISNLPARPRPQGALALRPPPGAPTPGAAPRGPRRAAGSARRRQTRQRPRPRRGASARGRRWATGGGSGAAAAERGAVIRGSKGDPWSRMAMTLSDQRWEFTGILSLRGGSVTHDFWSVLPAEKCYANWQVAWMVVGDGRLFGQKDLDTSFPTVLCGQDRVAGKNNRCKMGSLVRQSLYERHSHRAPFCGRRLFGGLPFAQLSAGARALLGPCVLLPQVVAPGGPLVRGRGQHLGQGLVRLGLVLVHLRQVSVR
jgi:hypothetical protein